MKLTSEEFDQAVAATRLKGKAKDGARLVLVGELNRTAAAKEVGVSRVAVTKAVMRVRMSAWKNLDKFYEFRIEQQFKKSA